MGRSQDALGTSSKQCGSPWARFWTKAAFNALAERPGELIFVNVGMSRGSSDVRSVPFLPMFCRCRTICASQASRTAKPRKNIPFEVENRRLGRPGRLPDGWWEQKNHVGWASSGQPGRQGQPDRASRGQIEPARAPRSSQPGRARSRRRVAQGRASPELGKLDQPLAGIL